MKSNLFSLFQFAVVHLRIHSLYAAPKWTFILITGICALLAKAAENSEGQIFEVKRSVPFEFADKNPPMISNGHSMEPVLSQSGTFVYFMSSASNLIADDSNGSLVDIFRVDLESDQILKISQPPNDDIQLGGVSAFWLSKNDIDLYFTASTIEGDSTETVHLDQIFHVDLKTMESQLISKPHPDRIDSQNKTHSDGHFQILDITNDGSKILVKTDAMDLFHNEEDPANQTDLVIYDRNKNIWTRAVRLPEGVNSNDFTVTPFGFTTDGQQILTEVYFGNDHGNPLVIPLPSGNESELTLLTLDSQMHQAIDFDPDSTEPTRFIVSHVKISGNQQYAIALAGPDRSRLTHTPYFVDLSSRKATPIPTPDGLESFSNIADEFISYDGQIVTIRLGSRFAGPPYVDLIWTPNEPKSSLFEVKGTVPNSTWLVHGFIQNSNAIWLKDANGIEALYQFNPENLSVANWLPKDSSAAFSPDLNHVTFSAIENIDSALDANGMFDIYHLDLSSDPEIPTLISKPAKVDSLPSHFQLTHEPVDMGFDQNGNTWGLISGSSASIPSFKGKGTQHGYFMYREETDNFTPIGFAPVSSSESFLAGFAATSKTAEHIAYLKCPEGLSRRQLIEGQNLNELIFFDSKTETSISGSKWLDPLMQSVGNLQFSPPAINSNGDIAAAYVKSVFGIQLALFDLNTQSVQVTDLNRLMRSYSDLLMQNAPLMNEQGSLVIVSDNTGFSRSPIVLYDVTNDQTLELSRLFPQLRSSITSKMSMTPDGRKIIFYNPRFDSPRSSNYLVDVSNLGAPTISNLNMRNAASQFPPVISRDGRWIFTKTTRISRTNRYLELHRYRISEPAELYSAPISPSQLELDELSERSEIVAGPVSWFHISPDGWNVILSTHPDSSEITDEKRNYFIRDLYSDEIKQFALPQENSILGNPITKDYGQSWIFKRLTSSLTQGAPSTTVELYEQNRIPISDEDGDSLHDHWETNFFGGIDVEPWQDNDGDGATNLYEFKHGMNPTIVDNLFTFSPKIVVKSDVIEISWQANPNDSYIIEYSNDLQHGDWLKSPVKVQIIGNLALFQHSRDEALKQFYRIIKLDPEG